eukprot:8481786-Heterocapsa_arctica.AAC.1
MGLGYIFAKTGYKEQKDMPNVINEVGQFLISFHHKNFKHKMRGQHPDTLDSWKDYEIMGDGEPAYEDWPWIGES